MTITSTLPFRSPRPLDFTARIDVVEGELVKATDGWRALFRGSELRAVAQLVVESMPAAGTREQVALAKLGAWICAFDDVVDGGGDDVEVALFIDRYEQLVSTGDCPELRFDPRARLLVEAIDVLMSRRVGRSLWSVFATQVLETFHAMRWERAQRETVTLAEYMRHAIESVFMKPVVTAAAMLLDDDHVERHLPALLVAERHMAAAIRLVNDLATRGREMHEGSVNALVLCRTDVRELEALASKEMRELDGALKALATPTGNFIRVFAKRMIDMYRAGKLR